MKTIGFVVPYFTCGNGTVHPMTQLWLDSCKYNRTVNMMDENITIEEMKKITKGNIFGWNFKGQLKRIMYLIYKKVRF